MTGQRAEPPAGAYAQGTGPEIVALYREARSANAPDFKAWAMARARLLLPLHSTHWINGVMTERGPVFQHVATEGMRAGYWEHYLTLMGIDPLGPRMFANPGASFLVDQGSVPPRIRDEIMVAFDVQWALQGMAADPTTGTFSVVCWHRDPTMPPFTEAERRLHEQLLPHWVECLHLHRVGVVLRDLHAAAVPGSLLALVEDTGLIHYAQLGFGELIGEEFAGWAGSSLPPVLESLRHGAGRHEGTHVVASWSEAPQRLWMVHASRRDSARRGAHSAAREAEARLLSASLEERERELDAARRALQEREKREAVLHERERILRELHDGVGAHLVGLRGLLRPGAGITEDMAQALEGALDEMRLAVDSMQASGEDDLGGRLASLRWRMQPRLEAAGIEMQWSVPEPEAATAACAGLGAAAVLQVQRLVLAALADIVRHSGATVVKVSFEVPAGGGRGWQLRISDDGVARPQLNEAAAIDASRGAGLRDMARRAVLAGVAVQAGPHAPPCPGAGESTPPGGQGVELRLVWPAPGARS